jgi:ketosteroid isomerase-like protein
VETPFCMESGAHSGDTASAMSEENVELVRGMNEAFDRGDFEGALARIHPDVEWHGTKGGLDDGRIARGHREVIAGFVEAFEAWERQSLETTDYFDAGDRVLVFFHEVAKGRESGAVVETDTGVIFTVKDGSVVRVDPYMDREEALEAAGLSK